MEGGGKERGSNYSVVLSVEENTGEEKGWEKECKLEKLLKS